MRISVDSMEMMHIKRYMVYHGIEENGMAEFKQLEYDSVFMAQAIRYSGKIHNYQLNMTQLNKLLYIAYGMRLVSHRERLVIEHPAAWPYGPVFPRVNRHIKLSDPITDVQYTGLSADIKNLIDDVVSNLGDVRAGTLSAWTHKEGSPWYKALARNEGKWNVKIDDDDIYTFFYSFVKADQGAANG